jgi:hypothetical protein
MIGKSGTSGPRQATSSRTTGLVDRSGAKRRRACLRGLAAMRQPTLEVYHRSEGVLSAGRKLMWQIRGKT